MELATLLKSMIWRILIFGFTFIPPEIGGISSGKNGLIVFIFCPRFVWLIFAPTGPVALCLASYV